MPVTANQLPAPNQTEELNVNRVSSSIPKGGSDDQTWLYPSPQMFWNALVRKDKVDGADESDMETVVAVHNNMNENTWLQVLSWESLHPVSGPEGSEAKLLRFLGRPDELSPKARLKMLFGHPAPFDRHDWIVDRGGKQVRYVIDYYHDESSVKADEKPAHMKDFTSMKSIKVDVRPALDSVESWVDRLFTMPMQVVKGTNTVYNPPPFFAPKPMLQAENSKITTLRGQWNDIQTNCNGCKLALESCDSEESCGRASMDLRLCTARIVCPAISMELDACIKAQASDASDANEAKLLQSFANMEKCLNNFNLDSKTHLVNKPKN